MQSHFSCVQFLVSDDMTVYLRNTAHKLKEIYHNYWVLYMQSRFNCVQFFATPWTVACWAPLSLGFSRQRYWSGLPFPHPGDLPDPGIEPVSLMSPVLSGGFFTTSTIWKALLGLRQTILVQVTKYKINIQTSVTSPKLTVTK